MENLFWGVDSVWVLLPLLGFWLESNIKKVKYVCMCLSEKFGEGMQRKAQRQQRRNASFEKKHIRHSVEEMSQSFSCDIES